MSNPLLNIFSFGKSKDKEKENENEKAKPDSDSTPASAPMEIASSSSSSTPWWRLAFSHRDIRVKDYPAITYSGPSHIVLPSPLSSFTSFSEAQLIDRIKGAVFGQCLGDALGVHTEFLSKARSYQLYGHGNLPFGEPIRGWAGGDWTDDSDQMVLILDMMLAHGGLVNESDFAKRLWYWVENGFSELGDGYGNGCGGVVSAATRHPLFIDHPHRAAREVYERSGGWAAANGAVMRTSILGVPNFYDLTKVVEQTRRVSTSTHFDPRCTASSILCTTAIALLLQGRLYDPEQPDTINKVIDEAFKLAADELRRCGEVETAQNKQKRKELMQNQKVTDAKLKEKENQRKEKEMKKKAKKAKKAKQKSKKLKSNEDGFESTGKQTDGEIAGQEQEQEKSEAKVADANDSEEDDDWNDDVDDGFFEAKSVATADLDSDDDAYALNEEGRREKISDRFARWMRELKSHCSVSNVEDLHLDEGRKIGYTYKCIGSGVWSLRENEFKSTMVKLVLEGGDADTNAAVAGAMLGAKLGYHKLPAEWLKLMPYREWLNKRLDRLLGYMGLQKPEAGVSITQHSLNEQETLAHPQSIGSSASPLDAALVDSSPSSE